MTIRELIKINDYLWEIPNRMLKASRSTKRIKKTDNSLRLLS